jgi:hypothetical protein
MAVKRKDLSRYANNRKSPYGKGFCDETGIGERDLSPYPHEGRKGLEGFEERPDRTSLKQN